MNRNTLLALGLISLLLPHMSAASTKPPFGLKGGRTSIEVLVADFLKAVKSKDEAALKQLRVSEKEYRDIIVPGSVKPGAAPRLDVAPQTSEYFWKMLNQKSEDYARAFIKGLGGKRVKRKSLKFSKGTRQFAWYTAHGDVELVLEDEAGVAHELHTGTVAEIDGRFKFIGFNTK
ncbi:MAG: hypothetical protein HY270_07760 [Deltaproteobacteria bacterium]|nr:hypothetical protein [Deltaproteobacteria bacterium]